MVARIIIPIMVARIIIPIMVARIIILIMVMIIAIVLYKHCIGSDLVVVDSPFQRTVKCAIINYSRSGEGRNCILIQLTSNSYCWQTLIRLNWVRACILGSDQHWAGMIAA